MKRFISLTLIFMIALTLLSSCAHRHDFNIPVDGEDGFMSFGYDDYALCVPFHTFECKCGERRAVQSADHVHVSREFVEDGETYNKGEKLNTICSICGEEFCAAVGTETSPTAVFAEGGAEQSDFPDLDGINSTYNDVLNLLMNWKFENQN